MHIEENIFMIPISEMAQYEMAHFQKWAISYIPNWAILYSGPFRR